MEEKKRAGVQTKMDPCFYKMVSCKVASVCKFGTDLNAPCLSFRCRWPGARRTLDFPAAGGESVWPQSGQTEGVTTGPSSCTPPGLDPRQGPKPPALAALREKNP